MTSNTFFKGILWFLLSLIASNFNDLVVKNISPKFPVMEIVFLKFLFGVLFLLPFIMKRRRFSTPRKHKRIILHSIRGLIFFSGISLWCYGLKFLPITIATVLSFTVPLFTLPLSYVFLKESVTWARWGSSLMGFLGITIIVIPSIYDFSWIAFTLIISSFLFAVLDIINKKFIDQNDIIGMLFWSALITACLSMIPTYWVWEMPTLHQVCLLAVSGMGANLVIYCLLKAFVYIEASALAPFHYLEFPLSLLTAFIFFQEIPSWYTILGASIIIVSMLFMTLYEFYRKRKNFRQ